MKFCLSAITVLWMTILPLMHADSLRVGVSVLPLESLVREIGGDAVEVRSIQQEGDSCSVFEPRPSSISWLSRATVFFRTGAAYEFALMEKIHSSFDQLEIVDLRVAVSPVSASAQAGMDHGHAHDHHSHACESCNAGIATDPHIWLDPVNVAAMADVIASTLSRVLPTEAEAFAARAEACKSRAMETHAALQQLLDPFAGKAFFIYHPALGYFARRYGLEQVPIASSGDAPTARELHTKIRLARGQGVKTVFVQPQESRRHAEILAEAIGAEVVEINPMERNWNTNLLQMGEALSRAFGR